MISLILPPKDQISRAAKMLADEFGTASNIKSRVNRLSVLSAITSTQQRLKLFTKVPPNGLVIYCGTILTDDNKEKKVNIDFEPFKPINTSLYLCDNKFHTEALQELLESDSKWGFIVMDGNGCLFGTLAGNTREILHKFSVDLPKKHGRGGQSALRFARLRLEKRQNYVRKVAEVSAQMFITNDKCNVEGIVLAGSADFKNDLHASDIFDNRLVAKVLPPLSHPPPPPTPPPPSLPTHPYPPPHTHTHPYPPPSTVPPLPPCPQGRLAALLGRLSRGLWALTSAEGLSSKGAAGRIQLRSLLRLMGVLLPLLSEEHQDMGVRQMLWAGT